MWEKALARFARAKGGKVYPVVIFYLPLFQTETWPLSSSVRLRKLLRGPNFQLWLAVVSRYLPGNGPLRCAGIRLHFDQRAAEHQIVSDDQLLHSDRFRYDLGFVCTQRKTIAIY